MYRFRLLLLSLVLFAGLVVFAYVLPLIVELNALLE